MRHCLRRNYTLESAGNYPHNQLFPKDAGFLSFFLFFLPLSFFFFPFFLFLFLFLFFFFFFFLFSYSSSSPPSALATFRDMIGAFFLYIYIYTYHPLSSNRNWSQQHHFPVVFFLLFFPQWRSVVCDWRSFLSMCCVSSVRLVCMLIWERACMNVSDWLLWKMRL